MLFKETIIQPSLIYTENTCAKIGTREIPIYIFFTREIQLKSPYTTISIGATATKIGCDQIGAHQNLY